MSRKRYEVAGRIFERQGDLEAAVKEHLNSHPLNTEFEDSFLAAVINEHHDGVRAAGQQVTGRFQYLDFSEQERRGLVTAKLFRGGKIVLGFFVPLNAWRDVTVYPWRGAGNPKRDIKDALRSKIARSLPHPQWDDRCARQPCPGRGGDLEYQHLVPTFDEVAEECLALMSEQEIVTRFGYSKFVPGREELRDLIPDTHPAIVRLVERHQMNIWEWLCAYHHRGVARQGWLAKAAQED